MYRKVTVVDQALRHNNPNLAEEVAKAGAIEQLATCIQDPETSLKKVATVTLGEIAKHNAELAKKVASNAGTLKVLIKSLEDRDLELRKYALICLAQIAKHNEELAQSVANAGLFPTILTCCLKEEKLSLQKLAVQCVKEIACQSVGLAKLVVKEGALPGVVGYLGRAQGCNKLPAIMTLGFIAGFDVELAQTVVKNQGHKQIIDALKNAKDDHIKSAAAWSLGQIGRHNAELGNVLASERAMEAILAVCLSAPESSDLRTKTKRALKNLVGQCRDLAALKPLLDCNSEKILKHVLAQVAVLLNADPTLKHKFAESNCLKRLQEIHAEPGSKLLEAITAINKLFPDDVVSYFNAARLPELIKQGHDYHNPPE